MKKIYEKKANEVLVRIPTYKVEVGCIDYENNYSLVTVEFDEKVTAKKVVALFEKGEINYLDEYKEITTNIKVIKEYVTYVVPVNVIKARGEVATKIEDKKENE